MVDTPHLIKSVRNNLKQYDFISPEGEVSWAVIVQFYERDRTTRTRMAPKLTNKHIRVPPFCKMKVSLATHVISKSVANGITWCVDFNIFPESCLATATFLSKFDDLFDVFNSAGNFSKSKYRVPISINSVHISFLKEMRDWINKLQYVKQKPDGSDRHIFPATNLPCFRGWIQSINALLILVEDLQTDNIHNLCTKRLNQDCVENMFSVVRGKGGHRDNPSPVEFRYAFRQIMVDRLISVSEYSNCQDDIDHFLLNLTPASKPRVVQQQPPTATGTSAVVSRCVDTAVLYQRDFNVQEENIIAYCSGFILKKMTAAGIMCEKCRNILEETTNLNQRHLGLIWAKQYEHCEAGGLFKPSLLMTNVVIVFEDVFKKEIKTLIKSKNVRQQMAAHLYTLQCRESLKDKQCDCLTIDYVIHMYITIRLHHEIKLLNQSYKEKRERSRAINREKKNRKLSILQHQ